MADSVTKRDLEEILDKKFAQYQGAILEAVDYKFQQLEKRMDAFKKKLHKFVISAVGW